MMGHGGSAPHPTVWDSGGRPEKRRSLQAARKLLGFWVPGIIWRNAAVGWPDIFVDAADVGCWPYLVGALAKLCTFLCSFHWPSTVDDLGVFGVSYVV